MEATKSCSIITLRLTNVHICTYLLTYCLRIFSGNFLFILLFNKTVYEFLLILVDGFINGIPVCAIFLSVLNLKNLRAR